MSAADDVLPGVERDPRSQYVDYTCATPWEMLVATIEAKLRVWFLQQANDGADADDTDSNDSANSDDSDDSDASESDSAARRADGGGGVDADAADPSVRQCTIDGASLTRLRLFLFSRGCGRGRRAPLRAARRHGAADVAPRHHHHGGLGAAHPSEATTMRETVRAQFGVSEFVLLLGAADELTQRARGGEATSEKEEEASVTLLSALAVALAAARRAAPHPSARLAAFVMVDGFLRPISGYDLPRASLARDAAAARASAAPHRGAPPPPRRAPDTGAAAGAADAPPPPPPAKGTTAPSFSSSTPSPRESPPLPPR